MRNVVIVGHGFKHDLDILRILNFDLHTSIVGILDVQWVANKVL